MVSTLSASEHHGRVLFGGLPVPGAEVTATHGNQAFTTITDAAGAYSFTGLADGSWTIRIEMLGFAAFKEDVHVAPDAAPPEWNLQMLPLSEIPGGAGFQPVDRISSGPPAEGKLSSRPAPNPPKTAVVADAPAKSDPFAGQSLDELSQRAADGFLINGASNNGAASPFGQLPAFGNFKRGPRALYTGGLGLTFDNSATDARPFSLTGQDTPKPAYNRFTGLVSFGGPMKIPNLVRNGPNFSVNYQWTRNSNASALTGLVPTAAERSPGYIVPLISPQAQALLALYPLPNFDGNARYNYQVPVLAATHQDSLQTRLNKTLDRLDQVSGLFALQSTRTSSPNIFAFLDTGSTLGLNVNVNWRHSFTQRFYGNLGFQFSRLAQRATPYFENRRNISGEAGIMGNNQEPAYWGPPSLNFSSGIASLSDGLPSRNRNQTSAVTYDNLWNRGRHNISFGGDFRRQEFNLLSQQDPRGTFGFTSADPGADLAGFLLGIPDTSSIAFGNADKYLRASIYEAYAQDDWRVSPGFTLDAGVRWEYWTPITELYGRLVNLDVAGNFQAVAPVLASQPVGTLTGLGYPDSLIHPDNRAVQPRIGFSWRPFSASSMVVRGGYGIYYNTSVYLSIATEMAQQYPLSTSLSVQNSVSHPLTLADGFKQSPDTTPNTFAVDPNLRLGYSQNWQLSVQRDLPGSLVVTATYLGVKGTRGMQEFLPSTYPAGAPNPCAGCPTGFVYLTSNGNSTREAGQFQLRRRLHNGFTASLQYTFSKSSDDVSVLGGGSQGNPIDLLAGQSFVGAPLGAGSAQPVIAQNWLDLGAERGLSNFDQRHLLNVQVQYTTGMGIGGGTLVGGWKGALFKEWTFLTAIDAGSGLPLNPSYLAPVNGTGVSGSIRPNYTGAEVYAGPPGLFLNPAAYTAPALGEWGNAGRNSITGPSQFSLSASMARTFRWGDRFNIDLRVDATNALNHVTFPSWNTTVNSAQFGLPNPANPMRSLQTTLRVRF